VVAKPSLPNLFLQASKTKPKVPRMIQDQSSTAAHLYDHKRESIPLIPKSFRAQNGSPFLSFEKNELYSQTITKFNKLIFESTS